MNEPVPPLERMVRKLGSRVALDEDDRRAILALPHTLRSHRPSTYLVREGEAPSGCAFILNGFAIRQKVTASGSRQIVSIHLRGDFIDLQNLFLNVSDHNVQALTELEVVMVSRQALQQLVLERPAVSQAMWIDALAEASIYREWVTNVGQRDARARVAHVLCEVAVRLKAAGLGDEDRFEFPLTQEQLGDAVGLTPVHVNRTLKSLTADGVVYRDRRTIGFSDWNTICAVGGFSPLYLHLDQVRPG